MTPEEREAWYDATVAPALLVLGKECQERGLSLLAACEWAPGEFGRTYATPGEPSFPLRLANASLKSLGNVDSLILGIIRYAHVHGHSSIYLHQLGVPATPPKVD